ncbi:MAG TPA: cysteine rich repeat-containing protein [Syntrophorhabdales bacterium]|nr:cysteine rich repeat-containing protein [Syntrophorhabdales bacterium]
MRRTVFLMLSFSLTLLFVGNLLAVDIGPVETAVDDCRKDIEMYCNNIRPGEGRLLACLYAHKDQLAPGCAYDLYNVSPEVRQAIEGFVYVSRECKDDLAAYCGLGRPGEGRLLDCLNSQRGLSARCSQALQAVGLWEPIGPPGGE